MLILGMDVGGTRARCLVADLDGRRLGSGEAGGGNPTAHGTASAVVQIRSALDQALTQVDRTQVAAAVIGIAGLADRDEAGSALGQMWSELRLGCPPQIVHDTLVAFAAGTEEASGTVIISGTGAAAVEVIDGREGLVADGIGWLLGDDGSGFWVGREAVRHVVRRASLGRAPDPLAHAVTAQLPGHPAGRTQLLSAAYGEPPVALARLAPVVARLAEVGDPAATGILEAAAALLEESAVQVRAPGAETPIVLCGGVFAASHLTTTLTGRLAQRWPAAPVRRAGNGAGGAAWLAARSLDVPLGRFLHRDLMSGV